MSDYSDGGPAFPQPMWPRQADGEPVSPCEFGLGGMTTRAWLAGQALNGYLSGRNNLEINPNSRVEQVAKACVSYADALIKELGI
jgi:hypothetical protein